MRLRHRRSQFHRRLATNAADSVLGSVLRAACRHDGGELDISISRTISDVSNRSNAAIPDRALRAHRIRGFAVTALSIAGVYITGSILFENEPSLPWVVFKGAGSGLLCAWVIPLVARRVADPNES